jgi:hypothetical protein
VSEGTEREEPGGTSGIPMYYHETYTLLRIIRERALIGQFMMDVEAPCGSSISCR